LYGRPNGDRVYPTIAAAARMSGAVQIEALIDVNGNVAEAHVVRSAGMLDGASVEAVRQWNYAPARLNGIPVAVRLLITINFHAN
jgi:periplasmic protein TonB